MWLNIYSLKLLILNSQGPRQSPIWYKHKVAFHISRLVKSRDRLRRFFFKGYLQSGVVKYQKKYNTCASPSDEGDSLGEAAWILDRALRAFASGVIKFSKGRWLWRCRKNVSARRANFSYLSSFVLVYLVHGRHWCSAATRICSGKKEKKIEVREGGRFVCHSGGELSANVRNASIMCEQ